MGERYLKKNNILVVGNPSWDEILYTDNSKIYYKIGGGIYYSIKTITRYYQYSYVDAVGSMTTTLYLLLKTLINSHNVAILSNNATCDTSYRLVYTRQQRELYLISPGVKIPIYIIGEKIYDISIVTPIFNEVYFPLIKRIRTISKVLAIDIQGFIRNIYDENKIQCFCPVELYDIISLADILHMNREEFICTAKCLNINTYRELSKNFPQTIFLVSNSWRPLVIVSGEGTYLIEPRRVEGDETGAGDILLTAFTLNYSSSQNIIESAQTALTIVSREIGRN